MYLESKLRVTKFNKEAWLKPNIDMNTDGRKNAKNEFETDFSSWWIMNAVFGKTMENLRKHRENTCNNWSKKELFSTVFFF